MWVSAAQSHAAVPQTESEIWTEDGPHGAAEREYIHSKAGKHDCVVAFPRPASASRLRAGEGVKGKCRARRFPSSGICSRPGRFEPLIMLGDCWVIPFQPTFDLPARHFVKARLPFSPHSWTFETVSRKGALLFSFFFFFFFKPRQQRRVRPRALHALPL